MTQIVPLDPTWLLMAFLLIIMGIILIFFGCIKRFQEAADGEPVQVRRETKAIVFLGPIPLVWGFSRKTQAILFVLALAVFIIAFFLFN